MILVPDKAARDKLGGGGETDAILDFIAEVLKMMKIYC
jgi:hypothetical protein